MTTTYPTLRVSGKEFVLVPKREFQRLTREDRESQKVARAVARLHAGKSQAVPLATVKKELGL